MLNAFYLFVNKSVFKVFQARTRRNKCMISKFQNFRYAQKQNNYLAQPVSRSCKNKRKKNIENFDDILNERIPNPIFDSDRIGVTCKTFGIKNCTCCIPVTDKDFFKYFMDSISANLSQKVSFYVDLTKPEVAGPSNSKQYQNSVISIPESNLNNSSVEVINLDDSDIDLNSTLSTENIDLKVIKNKKVDAEIKTDESDSPNLSELNFEIATNTTFKNTIEDILNEKIPKDEVNNFKKNLTVEIMESEDASESLNLSCPVCLDYLNKNEMMSTICGHLFCLECIQKCIRKTKECPKCRKKLTLKNIHPIYLV